MSWPARLWLHQTDPSGTSHFSGVPGLPFHLFRFFQLSTALEAVLAVIIAPSRQRYLHFFSLSELAAAGWSTWQDLDYSNSWFLLCFGGTPASGDVDLTLFTTK